MNLAEHVLRAGLSHPDKLALSVVGLSRADRWSHGRLRQAVLGTATGLRRHGLVQGDRLLIRMGNTPAFPVVYLAAIAAGVVPVPSSAMLTAAEITALSRLIGPAAIAADGTAPLPTDSPAQVLSLQELTAWRDLPPAEFVQGDPERMAYIVFTSGSGGTPRPVCHAHRAILARQMMFQGWYGLTAQDRVMHAGAFNWTFTLGTGLLDPWTMGASALIAEPSVGPEQLPLLAARHGASILAAAPGVFRRMLRAQWRPGPSFATG